MAHAPAIEKKAKKAGVFQWIIVIVVPLIFAITIALIILTLMGVDVIGKSKAYAENIPFLASVVTTDEEKTQENEVKQLEEEINTKGKEIEELTGQVSQKDQEIEKLNEEVNQLKTQLKEQESIEEETTSEVLSDVSSSFKDMEPEAAAPIISNIDTELAVSIIKQLPTKERGEILGAMDPTIAATLTSALIQDQE